MANRDNPHGCRPLMRTLSGGPCQLWQYNKVVGYGTAIFINDVVSRAADGSIEAGGTPGTTTYQGVSLNYGALSTATTHQVIVSPDALYDCQDNDDTDGFAAADMGLNANFEFNAGSAYTLISGHELDESTINTTNSLDAHLLEILDTPDNAVGEHTRVVVVINKHRLLTRAVTGV